MHALLLVFGLALQAAPASRTFEVPEAAALMPQEQSVVLGLALFLEQSGRRPEAGERFKEAVRLGVKADALDFPDLLLWMEPGTSPSVTAGVAAEGLEGDAKMFVEGYTQAAAARPQSARAPAADSPRALAQARTCREGLDAAACRAALAIGLSPGRAAEVGVFLLAAEPDGYPDEKADSPASPMNVLRDATRRNPRNALAWYLLGGRLLYASPAEAADAYRRAIALKPDWIAAYEQLARTLQQTGKFVEASDVLRDAARRLPGDSRLLFDLGVALSGAKRWTEAVAVLQPIANAGGAPYEHWMTLAEALLNGGRAQEAIAAYRRALPLAGRLEDRRTLGCRLREAGDWDGAAAAFQRALESVTAAGLGDDRGVPNQVQAREYRDLLLARADALVHTGHREDAEREQNEMIETFLEATRAAPQNLGVWMILGDSYAAVARPADALAAFQKASEFTQAGLAPKIGVASALIALGRIDDAIAALDEAIAANPKDVTLVATAVPLLEYAGRIDNALAARRRLFEEFAIYGGSYMVSLPQLDWAAIAERYRLAAAARPADPVAEASQAYALAMLGRREEAIDAMRQAIRLQPDAAWTHSLLGCFLQEAQRPSDALDEFGAVDRIDPQFLATHFSAKNCRDGAVQAMTPKER